MAEVVWRPQALRDLDAIEDYYEEVAADFALLFEVGAFESTGRISDFPNAGRIVPELGDVSLWRRISGQHRVLSALTQR